MEKTKATCLACSVGCGIEHITRHNDLLRVDSDWDSANGGLLCVHGRFEVVEPQPKRIVTPLVRKGRKLVAATWDEALAAVKEKLAGAQVAGLASPRLTNEELAAFKKLLASAKSSEAGLLYGQVPSLGLGGLPANVASLQDVDKSDCVVVVGGDPGVDQKVLAYIAKRAADNDGKLIVVSDQETALTSRATETLPLKSVAKIKKAVEAAERPVVLFAAGLKESAYATLRALPTKTKFLPLVKGTNAAGAAKLGLSARPVKGEALLVFAGDDPMEGVSLPRAGFVVAVAAYDGKWLKAADVVLPAQVWTEKRGHVNNLAGRELPVLACTKAPEGIPADEATLAKLQKEIA